MSPAPIRRLVDATELVRLRWVAVIGEAAAVGVLIATGQPGPWAALGALVLIGALSNLALTFGRRAAGSTVLGALLALDVVLLTAMFALTSGALTPFSPLYLVFPVLAALMLPPGLAWGAFVFVLVCYGALVLHTTDIPPPTPAHSETFVHTQIVGLYLAVAVGSPFLVSTILRTRRALSRADAELARAHDLEHRNARLASLATLAAGAAHELSSPLGTIAVAATELGRQLEGSPSVDDVRLIQAEVARCRQVLDELSADVGAGRGEEARLLPLGDLLDLMVHDRPTVEVAMPEDLEEVPCQLPPRMVSQAARRLIGNALDAAPGVTVRLDLQVHGGRLDIVVEDNGPGMPPAVLARAGEPFFSTKAPGSGRGLGLWFVRSVAAHLRGELLLQSTLGSGTRAVLRLPGVVRAPGDTLTPHGKEAT